MQIRTTVIRAVALGLALASSSCAQQSESADGPVYPRSHEDVGNPEELGLVRFVRDYDEGLARAKAEGKPVFLQFQEIPGCMTCTNYAQNVLSHPLLVEAAETLFVPVALRNNSSGDRDDEVRKQMEEPAWNNPVLRLVNAEGEDLLPRLDRTWTVGGIATGMVRALEEAEQTVPSYLRLLAEEEAARDRGLKRAVFAMHCFWVGEVEFAGVPGVYETHAAWHDGKEVVEVYYDPEQVSYAQLVDQAQSRECASTVYWMDASEREIAEAKVEGRAREFSGDPRADRDPKHHIRRTQLRHVPMAPLQAARVNRGLARRENVRALLSPRQLEVLSTVTANEKHDWPDVADQPFRAALQEMARGMAALKQQAAEGEGDQGDAADRERR